MENLNKRPKALVFYAKDIPNRVGAGCFSGRIKRNIRAPGKQASDYTEVSDGGAILKAKQGVD